MVLARILVVHLLLCGVSNSIECMKLPELPWEILQVMKRPDNRFYPPNYDTIPFFISVRNYRYREAKNDRLVSVIKHNLLDGVSKSVFEWRLKFIDHWLKKYPHHEVECFEYDNGGYLFVKRPEAVKDIYLLVGLSAAEKKTFIKKMLKTFKDFGQSGASCIQAEVNFYINSFGNVPEPVVTCFFSLYPVNRLGYVPRLYSHLLRDRDHECISSGEVFYKSIIGSSWNRISAVRSLMEIFYPLFGNEMVTDENVQILYVNIKEAFEEMIRDSESEILRWNQINQIIEVYLNG